MPQLSHRRSELKEAAPAQYGYANISVHEAYAAAITKGGSRPAAFVTQANYNEPAGDAYAPYRCPTDNMALKDGTPIICSSGTPKLFYCELATPRTPPDTPRGLSVLNLCALPQT